MLVKTDVLILLSSIIIRDGNCIMKQNWLARFHGNSNRHQENHLHHLKIAKETVLVKSG
ncbi:MAG: hypothetical protein WD491_03775 [Balneolales bacterium]